MPTQAKVVALDVDPGSLATLRHAFPECQVEATRGTTPGLLAREWQREPVDLVVIGARADVAATSRLCRGVRNQTGWADTPLLVLVLPSHEASIMAAIDAGANSCLVVPIQEDELQNVMARFVLGNCPGRHTLDSDRPQREDPCRDNGGEA